MQKKATYALNILFMILILGFTFYVLLRDQDMGQILRAVEHAQLEYILAAVACAVLFLVLESLSIQVILSSLGEPIRLIQGVKYTFISFLFNAITPSASGGQPMQVYYMKQDGIPIGASSVSLLFWTIIYKVALMVIEGVGFILAGGVFVKYLHGYYWLFWVGILVNVVSILLYSIVVFSKNGARKIVHGATWLCHKLHIVKRKDKLMKKMDHMLESYQEGAVYMRTHWGCAGLVLGITIVQRLVFFLITWFIYLSLGMHEHSMLEIVLIQSFVAVCIDILPFPGGVGANEGFTATLLGRVMGSGISVSAMLLTRGVSFYILVVLGVVVTLIAQTQVLSVHHQKQVQKRRKKLNTKLEKQEWKKKG